MRLLFFITWCLIGTAAGANISLDEERYALPHAPVYAQEAFREYYHNADSYTQNFVRKNWEQAQEHMTQAGIPLEDQTILYLLGIWESTWDHTAKNPRSSAYGLCQTMLSDHGDSLPEGFMNSPVVQLRWCDRYAHERYGGYQSALAHWHKHKWW